MIRPAVRADQQLVQQALAPSRSAAQRLIARGAVRWRAHVGAPWQPVRKGGDELPAQAELAPLDDA